MISLHQGDCLEIMPTIPAQSVDAVITDPPYPCIKRDYGMMTEAEWWDMMMGVCAETRRILKPTGSAVFILQPNSRKVGSMRGWLWEFMAWVCREWNMVQDVWWWNIAALPGGVSAPRSRGLLRQSAKACVWAGCDTCHRNQDAVLIDESDHNKANRLYTRWLRQERPSGNGINGAQAALVSKERGGSTPFNVLPVANTNSTSSAGSNDHGAGTPPELARWWIRYIVPPGGVVCDPFMGSGTMGLAAIGYGCRFIGIENMPKHFETAQRRIGEAQPALLAQADDA